jgi:glycosyltransferase involved in cell wall biosynthesis
MTGIVITVADRPAHTLQTFESLKQSRLNDVMIVIVDDCSAEETVDIVSGFNIPGIPIVKFRNSTRLGVKRSLKYGIEFLFEHGCEVVTNLDNDVKVKANWLVKLLELQLAHPEDIITGFHSTTKNVDGSERHPILGTCHGGAYKRSVGGINLMFGKKVWIETIAPALNMPEGNWDHEACKLAQQNLTHIVCAIPSLIQHTGVSLSSMGHGKELPDVAEGFNELELLDVTLIGVDTNHYADLQYAAMISQLNIKFGDVQLLGPNNIDISNKEEYNRFIIKDLYKYVSTPYMLIIQGDGYVLNYEAWSNHFFKHDYIGATWVYKDGMNVGNGGFSLRSTGLMAYVSAHATEYYPEDHVICRLMRPELEKIGYRFAPEEVANRFSIEAYSTDKLEGANKYTGQFGFHGWHVDYTDSGLLHVPTKPQTMLQKRKQISGGRYI